MATAARPRARSAASPNVRRAPKRDHFQRVSLFGEAWEPFPRGLLPWPLLRRLSAWLTDSAQIRLQEHLPPHYYYGPDSAPATTVAAAARYDLTYVAGLADYRLRNLLGIEMERLVRIVMMQKLEEREELRQEAILGTVTRLGQVYAICLKRWKRQRAREVFWECLELVLAQAQKAVQMLRWAAVAEERRAREKAQREAAQ
jgi:hypothetical protein